MHMADALISPAVGGTMWAATAVTTVYCARKIREENDLSRIPLMGVAGAFIFAAQMLNFTIPGTGSSGHLGGGLMLAVLLGPEAAFLVMASVLTVQALFFADGGLLALGANIMNLGFFTAFIAYPLVYRPIAGKDPSRGRIIAASMVAAIVGLQLGSLGVVLETTLSGVSELPFSAFVLLMQPIHLAIGVVEGIVTAAVILFVQQAQPELLSRRAEGEKLAGLNLRPVLIGFAVAAVLAGGVFSWFASTKSDGLEWSIAKVAGTSELETTDPLHAALARIQERTALLPGYSLRKPASGSDSAAPGESAPASAADQAGTSGSGLIGGAIVLAVAGGIGWALKRRASGRKEGPSH
jgi:cobalt/nickel transport system permease protein